LLFGTVAMDADALAERVARRLHALEATSKAWDLRFEGAGAGWAACSMIVRDDMLNGLETAHGGLIFALADTAFAWACNSRNQATFAHHAAITFMSPARAGERLVATAREEGTQGRSGVYTVQVRGAGDRLVAVFQGLSRAAGGKVLDEEELDND